MKLCFSKFLKSLINIFKFLNILNFKKFNFHIFQKNIFDKLCEIKKMPSFFRFFNFYFSLFLSWKTFRYHRLHNGHFILKILDFILVLCDLILWNLINYNWRKILYYNHFLLQEPIFQLLLILNFLIKLSYIFINLPLKLWAFASN